MAPARFSEPWLIFTAVPLYQGQFQGKKCQFRFCHSIWSHSLGQPLAHTTNTEPGPGSAAKVTPKSLGWCRTDTGSGLGIILVVIFRKTTFFCVELWGVEQLYVKSAGKMKACFPLY